MAIGYSISLMQIPVIIGMVRPEIGTDLQRMEALVKAKYPSVFLGRETTYLMEITYYDLNICGRHSNSPNMPRAKFTMTLR